MRHHIASSSLPTHLSNYIILCTTDFETVPGVRLLSAPNSGFATCDRGGPSTAVRLVLVDVDNRRAGGLIWPLS